MTFNEMWCTLSCFAGWRYDSWSLAVPRLVTNNTVVSVKKLFDYAVAFYVLNKSHTFQVCG